MSDNSNDLVQDFPEYKEKIHELKISNNHFKNLFEKYHELNKVIHRAELRIDHLSEDEEEELKKERLLVKDELFVMLRE